MSRNYQADAEEGIHGEILPTENDINKRNWGTVLTVCALGVTGVLAVSATNFGSSKATTTLVAKTAGPPKYASLSEDLQTGLFTDFKTKFNRKYSTDDEETARFSNFKTFLSQIDIRNAAEVANGGSAVHGVTKFADLTPTEFADNFLGFKADTSSSILAAKRAAAMKATTPTTTSAGVSVSAKASISKAKAAASGDGYTDWYMVYTTAVKNQGYCGSCWAFSATEQVESDAIRASILSTTDTLSPQQIVSCASEDDGCYGCDGGDPIGAYEYINTTGGLESDTDYPYESYYGDTETCTSDSSDFEVTVTDYTILTDETAMIEYVMSTGPLSVCADAESWASYTSGILSTCGDTIDHCIQATGVNVDENYWIIRNSWGTDWGLDGFIYLESGVDLCAITSLVSYTSVSAV